MWMFSLLSHRNISYFLKGANGFHQDPSTEYNIKRPIKAYTRKDYKCELIENFFVKS